jgi:outer membrane protein assembly factor BamB
MNFATHRIIKVVPVAMLLLATFSCSKDDDYDRKKAISVFVVTDHSMPDAALKNVKITLPAQQKNNFWKGSGSEQNQRVENIAKTFAFKKKTNAPLIEESAQIWSQVKFGYDDRLVFAPVIEDNKVFMLRTSGVLVAYELGSEKTLWKQRIFPRTFLEKYRTPKIYSAGGKIFSIPGINKIAAADQKNGQLIWSKDIAAIPVSSPISDGKSVYVITDNNRLYAFNADSGKVEWVHSGIMRPTAILGAADPVIYKNFIIAAYSSGEVYVINRSNGETIWARDLNLTKAINSNFYLTDVDATPVIKDDVIYAIGNGGLMMATHLKDGASVWKKEISGITDFWIAGDWIYVINNANKLLSIQRSSGLVKWSTQLPELAKKDKPQTKIIYNGIVLTGDKLVISSTRGDVIIASPLTGAIEKSTSIGRRIFHEPIAVDGKIYVHALSRFFVDFVELK